MLTWFKINLLSLKNFLSGYISWFNDVCAEVVDERYNDAKKRITDRIKDAMRRIENGIALLENNKDVKWSFCMANRTLDI